MIKREFFDVWVVLFFLVVLSPVRGESGVIFSDNFDGHPDWSPTQGFMAVDCYPGSCADVPAGYDGYRMQRSYYSNVGHNTININSENFRGSNGKALTFWSELCDSCGWSSDGILNLALNPAGYNELYVRFFIKFMPGWRWNTRESPQQKFFRISHFAGGSNVWTFGPSSAHGPLVISDLAKFATGNADVAHLSSIRYENTYYASNATPPWRGSEVFYFGSGNYGGTGDDFSDPGMMGDSNWHSWEFYVKLNTAVGVEDGKYKFWQDGVLVADINNIAWADSGSQITPRKKWNYIMLGGNVYNHYASQASEPEQWYSIDDLVVSTTYVGPGSTPPSPPPGTNNLPVANYQTISTVEDTAVSITLTGSDIDGDSLSYTVLTNPSNGSLSGLAPNLTYTPAGGYSGSDSFTFNVNDTTDDSATATVSITVAAGSVEAPPPPASDPSNQSLVAYFNFDGNATDISGNGNNGTANGVTLTAGKYGQSYSFNNVSQTVSIAEVVNLDGYSAFTVSAWFYTDVYGISTDYPLLLSKSSTSGYAIGFTASSNRIWAYVNGQALTSANGFMSDKLGGWHHVALAYNGSERILYVDGVNIASASQTGQISDTSSSLIIGNNQALNSQYSGSVDEVAVYNWAFSATQVMDVYTATSPIQDSADTTPPSAPVMLCGPGYDVDCASP